MESSHNVSRSTSLPPVLKGLMGLSAVAGTVSAIALIVLAVLHIKSTLGLAGLSSVAGLSFIAFTVSLYFFKKQQNNQQNDDQEIDNSQINTSNINQQTSQSQTNTAVPENNTFRDQFSKALNDKNPQFIRVLPLIPFASITEFSCNEFGDFQITFKQATTGIMNQPVDLQGVTITIPENLRGKIRDNLITFIDPIRCTLNKNSFTLISIRRINGSNNTTFSFTSNINVWMEDTKQLEIFWQNSITLI